jgi:hypothetical protein
VSNTCCVLCGALGVPLHEHHITARPEPGADYFDPALTLSLCPTPCHNGSGGVHQLARVVELEWLAPGASAVRHRLLLVALHAEVVAGADRPFALEPPSSRALASLLREAAGVIGGAT